MTDDFTILGAILVYRRVQRQYVDFDAAGQPALSDGAFRTKELSVFRCDRISEAEVLRGYEDDGLVQVSVQEIRDAGCIVAADEPPAGHLVAYRADDPGKRISGASAAKIARMARWIRLPSNP